MERLLHDIEHVLHFTGLRTQTRSAHCESAYGGCVFQTQFFCLRMNATLVLVIPFERLADSSRQRSTEAYGRSKGSILGGAPTEPDEVIEFDWRRIRLVCDIQLDRARPLPEMDIVRTRLTALGHTPGDRPWSMLTRLCAHDETDRGRGSSGEPANSDFIYTVRIGNGMLMFSDA